MKWNCQIDWNNWEEFNMVNKRLEDQINFILEIDKEKNIFRQTHLTNHGRSENDAEHAWHMAIMIYLLKEYSNEEIDLAKTMIMALIHDVVEIDAGDTYAYDTEGLATQKEREAKAAERIFGMLPKEQKEEMMALFHEFEEYETTESRFAHVMDNFQPVLLNDSNNGADWREHGVAKSQIYKRNAKTKTGSKEIWEYMQKLIEENIRKGNIKNE